MAQLLVRNLQDDVKERLRRLAEQHGRSLEQEIREILTAAALRDVEEANLGLGTRISRRFAGLGPDTEFPELRGELARPAEFEP